MNPQVELAKDVLKIIELQNISAKHGAGYFQVLADGATYIAKNNWSTGGFIEDKFGNTISHVLEKTIETDAVCQVCALGSMLIARCRQMEIGKISDDIYSELRKHFDLRSLALIELAFEGSNIGITQDSDLFEEFREENDGETEYSYHCLVDDNCHINSESVDMALNYKINNKFLSPKERLQNIMQNIIDNGKFDLEILCTN